MFVLSVLIGNTSIQDRITCKGTLTGGVNNGTHANFMGIGMYVYIIPTKIKMILNSVMCLRSVQKAGVGGGDDGSVTLVIDPFAR